MDIDTSLRLSTAASLRIQNVTRVEGSREGRYVRQEGSRAGRYVRQEGSKASYKGTVLARV